MIFTAAILAQAQLGIAGHTRDDPAIYQNCVVFGRGDSDRSYRLFQQLGINLSDPDVYEAVIRRMTSQQNELESLLGEK